jgi:uncharacterized membrane protein
MQNETSKGINKTRVEALSDGILAIIITLLVLEIKAPHLAASNSALELFEELGKIASKFISWIISFFTICVIWLNHHRLFKIFQHITPGLFWWNSYLLLWVSFIPFPTALLGDFPLNPLAVSFYGFIMAMMALAFSLMRLYVNRQAKILGESIDRMAFKKGTYFSIIFGPVPYLIGAGLAWMWPYASFAIYLAIPLYFIFPHAAQD